MEYYKEYGERGECRYGLRAIESCRKCLFETLCRLEKDKKKEKKREGGTLNNNANTNENATTEIIND